MKVASWNIEGRLSRFVETGMRGSPEHIVEEVEKLDFDVGVFPEAFDATIPIESEIYNDLEQRLGYSAIVSCAYEDIGYREVAAAVSPQMLLLSRAPVESVEIIRPGGIRNMLVADVINEETRDIIRFFGIHLDDRDEETRLKQAPELIDRINDSPYPVVAMGDFNAMPGSSLQARIVRLAARPWLIDKIPSRRIQHIAERLSEMAIGETLCQIETGTNLIPADQKRRSTMTPKMRGLEKVPSIPFAPIDHIYGSRIEFTDHEVANDGGSDHRSITASIRITRQK